MDKKTSSSSKENNNGIKSVLHLNQSYNKSKPPMDNEKVQNDDHFNDTNETTGLVPASALSSTEDEAEVIDGAVVRNSEFFTLSRPDSVSVSKSSENRKVKSAIGSRSKSSLPVPLKKKVLASPEENQTIFSPLSGKDLLSPGNSTVSLQKSTPSRPSSTKTRQRPQTARLSRPDDEKFSVKEKNFLSPECSGFLRPTASSKAKAFGTPTTPKPSPSKSVGNSRRNSHMMGDAGADGSSPTTSVGASGEPGVEPVLSASLKEQFGIFSRFGDASSDGKQISLSNADKWMKQAHVIDGKKITTTDTSITFKKLFKTSKKVGFEDFKRYVEDLSKSKSMEGKEILDKLTNCGTPGLSQATKAAHAGVVSRLTDTSKYTGSSKERFDSAGKGRGMVGRKDVKDTSGYVAAFKEKQDGQSTSPTPK